VSDSTSSFSRTRGSCLFRKSQDIGIGWYYLSTCLALVVRFAWRGLDGSHLYCFGRSTHTIFPLQGLLVFRLLRRGYCEVALYCTNPFELFDTALSSRIPLHYCYGQGICRTERSASRCTAGFSETYEIALYYTLLPLARSRQSL
jgi:hypothetical protein